MQPIPVPPLSRDILWIAALALVSWAIFGLGWRLLTWLLP